MATNRPTAKSVFRTTHELHHLLKRECARRGMSLNALCVSILESGVSPATAAEVTPWTLWVDKARSLHGGGLRGVALFGSVARGQETESSDVDLLVVLADDVPIARELYRRWDDTEPTDDRVFPHLAHFPHRGSPAGSLWIEVALDGRVLHDPFGEVTRTLSSIRRERRAAAARGRPRVGGATVGACGKALRRSSWPSGLRASPLPATPEAARKPSPPWPAPTSTPW